MLGKLFGSRARVKILKLFLLHPDKKYYIRQLARDLKLQVNSVRRELENLEEFGLLVSNISAEEEGGGEEDPDSKALEELKQGIVVRIKKKEAAKESASTTQVKKYYQANQNFILFEETKALIIKAQALHEKDFINKLKKIGQPKLFVLSGFFVGNPSSSVDILVVGRVNKNKLDKLIKDLEKELDRELKYTLMETQEFKYRRDITDTFLYGVLEGRKVVVIDKLGV
ncbi:hypothetical protein COV49_00580 [Candidatus Falkowbacteria bacterium CG11_big_fil_rev_8_21_14_0_20_39_10]|uniref:HTH arsR-type domain-containing protein n=1 Tax=Candidatus Falkowbacteria bacterium CG11_big_fil_rev_8_21_14_0_20_39_10 TaxID=1974570 RepID=A0A2M6K9Z2_9BACT|nr:MAG: hypothetical protein COV49_00580 [Candidatus Falkowbacteria bacterium CG11_big_fil_rev_8_21_14_0_20_39_10]